MIVCKWVLKVYHCIFGEYVFVLKACECFIKAYEYNLKAYEYTLRPYECIWNVYDSRHIPCYNVVRSHKAAMAFHIMWTIFMTTWFFERVNLYVVFRYNIHKPYFMRTKRYILTWKSNYNLKEDKNNGKKLKITQQNMKKKKR